MLFFSLLVSHVSAFKPGRAVVGEWARAVLGVSTRVVDVRAPHTHHYTCAPKAMKPPRTIRMEIHKPTKIHFSACKILSPAVSSNKSYESGRWDVLFSSCVL